MPPQLKTFKLDRRFFKRFWIILKILFPKWFSAASFFTVYILLINILDQVITYYLGIVPSQFYMVLGGKDKAAFGTLVIRCAGIILAKCLVLTTLKFSTALLNVHWRRILCHKIHSMYFKGHAFYEINAIQNDQVDNVDQRITQDAEKTCRIFCDMFAKLIISPFVVAYYTYLTFTGSGYIGPLVIYLYFIIGTIVNKFLMTPIITLTVEQEKREGNFRYKHMAVRSHAEAISFYQAGLVENFLTNEKLFDLVNTQERLVKWQYPLMSTNIFDYFGSILSYLILGIAVFIMHSFDDVDPVTISGITSKYAFYYLYLINSFSTLIDLSGSIGELAGSTHRVAEAIEYFSEYQNRNKDNDVVTTAPSYASMADGQVMEAFSLNLVSYRAPRGRNLLAKDLCLSITKNTNLLIIGASNSGKSSVFRVLNGLWKVESGSVSINIHRIPSNVLFIPQKPYFPQSTLRQQIVYPYRAECFPSGFEHDKAMLDALYCVRLDHLVERCGGLDEIIEWNWIDELSPGELQRLALARLFFHKPQFAFLDEATSAVGMEMEQRIYEKMQELFITIISIGHRRQLYRFHHQLLYLDGEGAWTLREINGEEGDDNFKTSLQSF